MHEVYAQDWSNLVWAAATLGAPLGDLEPVVQEAIASMQQSHMRTNSQHLSNLVW